MKNITDFIYESTESEKLWNDQNVGADFRADAEGSDSVVALNHSGSLVQIYVKNGEHDEIARVSVNKKTAKALAEKILELCA